MSLAWSPKRSYFISYYLTQRSTLSSSSFQNSNLKKHFEMHKQQQWEKMHQNAIFMGEKIIDSELFPFEKNCTNSN